MYGWIKKYQRKYPKVICDLCSMFLNPKDSIVISTFHYKISLSRFTILDNEIIQNGQTNKIEKCIFCFHDQLNQSNHYWNFQIISPNIYDHGFANGMMMICLQGSDLSTQYSWSLFQPFIESIIDGETKKKLKIHQKYKVNSGDTIQVLFDSNKQKLHFKTKNGIKKIKNTNIKSKYIRIKLTIIPMLFKKLHFKLLSCKMIY